MAYPMAFLISPEQAKGEKLNSAFDASDESKSGADKSLRFIKVLTNITYMEYIKLMIPLQGKRVGQSAYVLPSGLIVEWDTSSKYLAVNISGKFPADMLQNIGEKFFTDMDELTGRNVRLINASEYFYYNYSTGYMKASEIYKSLKSQGATAIFSTENDEVVANVDGKNVRYYHHENETNYTLEVEQKILIKNIGIKSDQVNIFYGLSDLKIKTNIKREELKKILTDAGYNLYKANMETLLKTPNINLNWTYKDGYYTAEFSGYNNSDITKEAEQVFKKINEVAGRDLRMLNDVMTAVYTYKTNYTDKGILLNTLTEHGAEGITEASDRIKCRLYGMEMSYYKKEGSNGYMLEVTQVSDKAECEGVINDLNDEYGLNIQEMTYNKIKERLDSENMRLESETVMEDNSIVLTIEI